MVDFRHFKNTDAPGLVRLWNESCTGRGAVYLRGASALEERVFAKPYFDPAGLIVAEENGECIGFAHAGFGPNETETELAKSTGVVSMVVVHPRRRRRGVAAELLSRCEAYLRAAGSQAIHAGPFWPLTPFYFGLYGGSGAPGFLASDGGSDPFFTSMGYVIERRFLVWQRRLNSQIKFSDARGVGHRQQYDLRVAPPRRRTWWQETVFCMLDTPEFYLEDKLTKEAVAHARMWEMTPFALRWGAASAGIVDLEVKEPLRRRGLGKFLLALLLRHLQEQFFEIVEIQTAEGDVASGQLCRGLAFDLVDTGCVYRKQ